MRAEADGFEATVKTDVKRRALYQRIDAFAAPIAASPDTVGLFYYVGHGINGPAPLTPVLRSCVIEAFALAEGQAVRQGRSSAACSV